MLHAEGEMKIRHASYKRLSVPESYEINDIFSKGTLLWPFVYIIIIIMPQSNILFYNIGRILRLFTCLFSKPFIYIRHLAYWSIN